jgi:hypothetical protein
MTPELDVVTDPSFLSDLAGRDMDELRAVRSRCQSLENSLSYVRRLIQGRVDIVGGELQRRRDGGATGDTSELIGRLPDILSEGSRASGGPGSVRPPHSLLPDPEVTAQLESMLEDVIAADALVTVSEMDADTLAKSLSKLNVLEDLVSENRRRLHTVIDTVQAEVTRRYTTGEATVDGLLSS